MKQDKRTKRTRAWLLETLLELIEEKNYAEISITELTERADIARQTFYRNYESKDDILLQKLDEIREVYLLKVHKNLEKKEKPNWDFEVNQLILLWQENETLFKALQKASLSFQALEKFTEIFSLLHLKIQKLHRLDEKHQYLVAYLSGGVYMVLNKWFKDDMNTPVELLRDLFTKAAENINQIAKEYSGS